VAANDLGEVVSGDEVDIDGASEPVKGLALSRSVVTGARVIHEYVDLAESIEGVRRYAFDIAFCGHIGDDRRCASHLGYSAQLAPSAGYDRYLRSGRGQHSGEARAESTRGAGHESHPAIEPE
jgi:hypothetical protein